MTAADATCRQKQRSYSDNAGVSDEAIATVCGCVAEYYADRLTNDEVLRAEAGGQQLNAAQHEEAARRSCVAKLATAPAATAPPEEGDLSVSRIARTTPASAAICDVTIEPDHTWVFQDERCAFTPQPQLGKGSFLLEFHSSPTHSLVVRVDSENQGRLFLKDRASDQTFHRSDPVRREGACWRNDPRENYDGLTYEVCARAAAQ